MDIQKKSSAEEISLLKSRDHRSKCLNILKKHKLIVATVLGVILGILLGILLRYLQVRGNGLLWVKIWGEIFLRLLKLVVLPLMVSCLVTGKI